MKQKTPKYTIKKARVYTTGEILTADAFFSNRSLVEKKRVEFEEQQQKYNRSLECVECNQALGIRGDKEKTLFWKHTRKNTGCSLIKENNINLTEDQINAIQYNGQKEGRPHRELKEFVAEHLELNEKSNKGISKVQIDKRAYATNKKWRQPDVQAFYQGSLVAFEIQLSTTSLNVIVARQLFYREDKKFILWIFDSFNTRKNRKFVQTDILVSNNYNVFELDEEAKRLSKLNNDLYLKCSYQVPELQGYTIQSSFEIEYVNLSQLTFDTTNYQIYFYDTERETKRLEATIKYNKEIHKLNSLKYKHRVRYFINRISKYYDGNASDKAKILSEAKNKLSELPCIVDSASSIIEKGNEVNIRGLKLGEKELVKDMSIVVDKAISVTLGKESFRLVELQIKKGRAYLNVGLYNKWDNDLIEFCKEEKKRLLYFNFLISQNYTSGFEIIYSPVATKEKEALEKEKKGEQRRKDIWFLNKIVKDVNHLNNWLAKRKEKIMFGKETIPIDAEVSAIIRQKRRELK